MLCEVLAGTGATSLTAAVRGSNLANVQLLFSWLDFAVRLFYTPPAGTDTLFAAAAHCMSRMIQLERRNERHIAVAGRVRPRRSDDALAESKGARRDERLHHQIWQAISKKTAKRKPPRSQGLVFGAQVAVGVPS